MAISLRVRTGRGEDLIQPSFYVPASASRDVIAYPLLASINPYGATMFNPGQMMRVRAEVAHLAETNLSAEERASLEEVDLLCAEYGRQSHRFLWFLGD